MDRFELQSQTTDWLLRRRDALVDDAGETPAHLYPLSAAYLSSALRAVNAVLSDRASSVAQPVQMKRTYDADGPLEDALEPRRAPRLS